MNNINEYALSQLLNELNLIEDPSIRGFAAECISKAPGEYWKRPSAFFKGHHPDDELGGWGNLIHVKKVIVIAQILCDIEDIPKADRDILYAGLIIHDIGKYGVDGKAPRIQVGHPELVPQIVGNMGVIFIPGIWEQIRGVALSHMGRWGNIKPVTAIEKIGHYADAIGSRHSIRIQVTIR